MPTDKLPNRFIVIHINLGEVTDHTASKKGDQLVEFASAVGEHVEIIQEGIVPEDGAIVCPHCGNETFQEHGTMQFRQRVTLKRSDTGMLEVEDYTSPSEPLEELSEPVGVECSQCLKALDVDCYGPSNAGRRHRIRRLIEGYCGAPDDPESDLTDALTDMCHLAASRGFSVEALTERALSHFRDER
jgi:hypothetical protein